MSVHEQFDEDLALFALGELSGERRLAVERHLQECPDCRRELDQLWGDLALLALSASGPEPPARSRERLMAAITNEPRRTHEGAKDAPPKQATWLRPLGWAVAAVAVIAVLFLWNQNASLRRSNAGLETNLSDQRQQLAQANALMASLTSAEAQHFTLVASKTPPQPQGKVLYVPSSGTLVFLGNNLPQPPPEKTYELWLIPASGPPIPAGLFKPSPDGSATLLKPPLPLGVAAKAFAITIEGESGSPAPTSQPIMVGAQG